MECRGHSRAATRPAPQSRSNPAPSAIKESSFVYPDKRAFFYNNESFVFSMICSISAKIVEGLTCNASPIRKKVSSVGLRTPRSIALRCVRPIPARPLRTSCETPLFSRNSCITFPTITGSSNLRTFFLSLVYRKKMPRMSTYVVN